jgi:hypothetical protein
MIYSLFCVKVPAKVPSPQGPSPVTSLSPPTSTAAKTNSPPVATKDVEIAVTNIPKKETPKELEPSVKDSSKKPDSCCIVV